MHNHANTAVGPTVAAVIAILAGGCLAPRSETFSQLDRRRAEAYARWRDAARTDEALPRLTGDLGLQDAAKERLMRAYFTESEPIGDPDTLVRLMVEIGVDPDEARESKHDRQLIDVPRRDTAQMPEGSQSWR